MDQMPTADDSNGISTNVTSDQSYAMSGRIMLSAIIILLFVVLTMVCLHLYARWYLQNARRRQLRRQARRHRFVFFLDPNDPNPPFNMPSRGLDESVLKTLPVFTYDPNTQHDLGECAVCLSEFELNEKGRLLPKCNHSFHIECIDMWFHSHETCPLCRTTVEAVPENNNNPVPETESSSANLCGSCQQEEIQVSVVDGTGRIGSVTIEVPARRNGGFEDESTTESPSTYRSPISRMLSFTRLLSRERRRGNLPSPGSNLASGSEGADIEKGRVETSQDRTGSSAQQS